MCTVVVLVRPGHSWPLMLAANRDEQLARAIFEYGHVDNTIEVYGSRDNLFIICGHCHQVTNWRINGGQFCCRWAGAMYQKYFEWNFLR